MDIEIRKAADTDFDFFYSIKCEEDNMYWSGHTSHPQYDTLFAFFAEQIRHPDIFNQRTILIVEEKQSGQSVGYLYLDPTGIDSAEISIAIAQSFSGRGFGRQAVCALCKYAWDYGFKYISAMIREDNIKSQKMFTHAGFAHTDIYDYQFIQNLNKEVKMIRFEKGRQPELGSEFDIDLQELNLSTNGFSQYIGNLSYYLFNSGRSALKAIAHMTGHGQVLMPEYICESVIKCFPEDQVIFYRLKKNLQIDTEDLFSKISDKTAVVYLMHYFGSLQPENILSLLRTEKEKLGFTIIEDTTHSIFTQTKTISDYCVASLRKWFPLPNGGVLYASVPLNTFVEIPRSADNDKAYAMMLKHLHLSGRMDCNPTYRALFTACEEKLDNQKEIKRISDLSEFLLNCYDVEDMVKRRAFNLSFLKNKLNSLGIRQLCNFSDGDCPFTLPILVPERDAFRSYLMEHRIFCAVHWPFDGFAPEQRPLAVSLSSTMLSLPIDQRYGQKEMEYLATVIGAYKGRLQL